MTFDLSIQKITFSHDVQNLQRKGVAAGEKSRIFIQSGFDKVNAPRMSPSEKPLA